MADPTTAGGGTEGLREAVAQALDPAAFASWADGYDRAIKHGDPGASARSFADWCSNGKCQRARDEAGRIALDPEAGLKATLRALAAEAALARASAEQARVEAELNGARATNRHLHRRMQAVEGPMLKRAQDAERSAAFWLNRRKFYGGRAIDERHRAEAAEARVASLAAERDRLKAALEEATSTLLRHQQVQALAGAPLAVMLALDDACAALKLPEAPDAP